MTTGAPSARPPLDWRRNVQLCLILRRCSDLLSGNHAACNFAHLQMDIKTKQELGAAACLCTITQSMVLAHVSGLTCGFSWGCQSSCEQDFRCWCGHCGFCVCARIGFACSQTCPQDWTEVQMNPGICTVGRSLWFACIRDHAPSHVFRGADNVSRRFNQVDLDAQQWMFFYCLCLQGLVVSV